MIESTDIELEDERLKRLAAMARERGMPVATLLSRNAPGTLGGHEATHTASIVLDLLDQHLVAHPAIVGDAQWFRLASRASEALFNLYQAMGAAQIDQGQPDEGLRPEELNASNDA
ncbi:hypothetical protein LXM94_01975 [Rhizobium sp. TRM95111]|uniref:hypothetical protein n=1 Tax=Rhizobium alarense TaxID=2846851 RepID=UPI001F302788|nr:hypothetical protein [Rhizobium alarense]MCF3638739.1 hypothetical protein [Rhizobium alarense]